MKRFHVHLHVDDLARSIGFYSKLFAAQPTRVEADYAKWMLDDPRINFAISTRDQVHGVNHLGLQVESDEELTGLEARLKRADAAMVTESSTTCCYANSDKYWVTDPQGVAWETFHTLGNAPVYGESPAATARKAACCVPPATDPRPASATPSCDCAA